MSPYPTISPHVQILSVNGSDQSLVRLGDKTFYVSPLLALILGAMRENTAFDVIRDRVNDAKLLSRAITRSELEAIIANKIVSLGLSEDERSEQKVAGHDIYFKLRLIDFNRWRAVLPAAGAAFARPFFAGVFVLAALVSLGFVLLHSMGTEGFPVTENATQVAALAMVLLVIGIAHELGHSSAAHYFGAKPGDIGIGLYIIFPVLYADVTDVWRLSARERVVVNLGGIYFQLLFNCVLIALYGFMRQGQIASLCLMLIYLNLGIVVVNLNPFMKFDGYWVLADAINMPNLRQDAYAYLGRLWSGKLRGATARSGLLPLYAGGMVLFNLLLIALIAGFYLKTLADVRTLLAPDGQAQWLSAQTAGLGISVLILTVFSWRMVLMAWQYLRKSRQS
ncbi:MAG: hypothetical protein WKG03_19135 [Telluria sp.]